MAAKSVSTSTWPPAEDDDADAAFATGPTKDDWGHHLPPLDMPPPGPGALTQDNTFLHWIIGGGDASSTMPGVMDHEEDSVLDLVDVDHMSCSVLPHQLPVAPPPPGIIVHQLPHPHPAFPPYDRPKLLPLPPFAAGPTTLKAPKAEAATDDSTTASAVDQLAEAAKRAEAGDVFGARGILARLDRRLPAVAGTTPLLRSAFYFKEALRVALSSASAPASPEPAPADIILKLGAHKAFSEVSPVLQFAHFTCVQAVLDELGPCAGCIHVLDFDIGVGEQWASLMQELAHRRPGAALKVTALQVSAASHHDPPWELQLVHDSLSSFAAEIRVPFQFAFFDLDTMDPAALLAIAAGDAIAVHLPVGSVHAPAVPSVLHLVRRLGARLLVSVDRSCDRSGSELPFAAHLFQAFQSCVFLLESLDAVGTGSDVAAKIERFLIQPMVERCVVKRYRAAAAGDKATPPWRAMLASAGFVPVQASSFSEAQADSLLKKVPVRGFRLEKRAGSLVLHWQRGELISVSAWRC